MAKRIFREVFSEGGKLPEAAGGPLVEVGAEQASNQAAVAVLGGWLQRRVLQKCTGTRFDPWLPAQSCSLLAWG